MAIIISTSTGNVALIDLPQECPFCHKSITPTAKSGHIGKELQVLMLCPNNSCKNSFIGYYNSVGVSGYRFIHSSKGEIVKSQFTKIINEISPNFSIIYNQSFYAEQENLLEICGVGYRKALEFLIKDYLVSKDPDNKDKIEVKLLGRCIDEHITDNNIKTVAKRAAWLGNDETHYIRKWEGKNLNDLKKLIQLTIHWIEMEALTKSFEVEMPG
ncbi:MAG: hypothetical protein ABIN91_23505 [Mucilaginibacter sp.]|uniref:hypothetical protein n=1 Tax=Mucilaginibacter sp. TaxID=1882438 RepID=UPI0032666ECC